MRWNNAQPLLSAVFANSALGTFLCDVEDILDVFASCCSLVLPPLVQTKWQCAALHENVILLLYHQRMLWLIQDVISIHVIQADRPREPQHSSMYWACVLKAIKSLRHAAYVCTHLSEAYTSLSTLLAVAVEMKYWPPESHLAPNWAILLLFSPFRLWLSLLQSDGWKRV